MYPPPWDTEEDRATANLDAGLLVLAVLILAYLVLTLYLHTP
jgi:hypothetical protein